MASILRKALRNNQLQSATSRIITNLNKSEPPTSILSATPPQLPILAHLSQIPFLPQPQKEDLNLNFAYPSFSFGFFLNPISQIGMIKSENNDEGLKIWADSVKKKRKRKMNKHKLKKLSKRLRRKTKA